jgi:RNA polymerase sigma-70 factor (ECF subfamily)
MTAWPDPPAPDGDPPADRRLTRGAPRPAAPTPAHDDPLAAAIVRAAEGDEDAFRVIYRAIQPGLLRYLRQLVGGDAEDVAAETWVQVTSDIRRFSGGADAFRGWVATIGRHRALDHLRRLRRRPISAMPIEDLPDLTAVEDTSRLADEALRTRAALQLIATLPPDQAEAVLLRAVMGLTADTAAQVLGKRAGAVRTAAHRGLKRLAAQLDAQRLHEQQSKGPDDE